MTESIADLMRATFERLAVVTGLGYVLWHLAATVTRPEHLGARAWLLTFALMPVVPLLVWLPLAVWLLGRAVLVHACVLVRTPVEDINRYIRHPEDEPEYRAGRRHRDFLTDVCSLTGLSVGKAESELAARVSACFSESMVREGAAF